LANNQKGKHEELQQTNIVALMDKIIKKNQKMSYPHPKNRSKQCGASQHSSLTNM